MTILFTIFTQLTYISFDANNEKRFNYIGSIESMTLKRGLYKIDIYGAQGGYGYGDGVRCGDGGKGAHVSANFYITSINAKEYFVAVGGQGTPNSNDPGILSGPNRGGYNGGGSGGQDEVWNPAEDQNDGPGGGGGGSDIRTNRNDFSTRLIVAGGGSGGSWWDGSPGGGLCGMKLDGNNNYICSTNTNTIVTNTNKCINVNGIGGNGANSYETPRSGGGGGFCGGFSDNGEEPKYPFTADSGSSYAKECQSDHLENELCFFNVVMNVGKRSENGLVIITKVWECKDDNCLFCKDADNKCQICKNNFLYYNGGCVSQCPKRTVQDGDHCYDCEKGCDVCTDRTTCTKCIDNYFLYNNNCLTKCPETTTVSNDGKSCIDCVSPCYSCEGNVNSCSKCVDNYFLYNSNCLTKCPETTTVSNDGKSCIDCVSPCYSCTGNVKTCTKCIDGYYLYNNNCLSQCPRGTFADASNCSPCNNDCDNCVGSADFCLECKDGFYFYDNRCYLNCNVLNNEITNEYFGKNNNDHKCQKCSDENCIDCSNNFNACDKCSQLFYLNETTCKCIHIPTNVFTNSYDFTISKEFTKSHDFTFSKIFSNSIQFTVSNEFSASRYFTNSNVFSNSNEFSESNKFTFSSKFSNSVIFADTNIFSVSNYFTKSNIFSETNKFTFSNIFSKSECFSFSNEFTESMTFTPPFRFRTTISESQFKSYTLVRSVSFSFSFYLSEIKYHTMINNEISFIVTNSYLVSYFPYIIKFYSLTDRPTIIIFELPWPRRITAEMLIGICCGCASVLFFILAIIIMIYKKKYKKKYDDFDYSISDENEIKSIPKINDKQSNENMINMPKSDSDDDINFWL